MANTTKWTKYGPVYAATGPCGTAKITKVDAKIRRMFGDINRWMVECALDYGDDGGKWNPSYFYYSLPEAKHEAAKLINRVVN